MTKILMISSASYFLVLGFLLTFLPKEIYGWLEIEGKAFHLFIAQSLGASMLALATLNWFTRNNILGGIYGKPLMMANFLFFFVSFMTCLKSEAGSLVSVITVASGIFSTSFGYITFTHPFNNE